ncbi:MAG: MBL fold metallo-hydrolase [Proteobacteria bacterium]|nr:MBL fold metallo-hydrolase [Desulfobacteraceae bacterium]MBU0734334.1 MBL fold metallo-hydrolase [Pseudomonadota bacterium]MBU0988842.1 MBL fold metallo-hydrolase [Pseudomonadota bacterium]MBU1905298.1 MBL fold metallo-hydrolase [Pseudomonadota bacterium]
MIRSFTDKITWLGHDGFRIDAGKTIYIDPYQIEGGPVADVILISHDHFDHCSPEDVQKIQGPDTVVVTEKDSAKKLTGDVRVVKPGDTVDLGDVKIEAVPSYNTDKDFHPKKNGWLGFVVETEGVKVYHAGDADFIPEMKNLEVDIALLPVSGTYVMTADQAVKAALAINPKLAIPMHYGAIVGDVQDALNFEKALEGKVDVLVLEKG